MKNTSPRSPPCNSSSTLGFEYLPPEQALKERQGKTGNVLLEDILREQLKTLNRITTRAGNILFSEENIQSAIQRLKNVKFDGLQRPTKPSTTCSPSARRWNRPSRGIPRALISTTSTGALERNNFHVTAEFSVERSRSTETARPDLVLFVNGIPLAVIECKSPKVEVEQAISQAIRNQGDDYIPKLFIYTQLVMGVTRTPPGMPPPAPRPNSGRSGRSWKKTEASLARGSTTANR